MKKYKYPIIISLIVFAVCLVYSFCVKAEPWGDEVAYDNIAWNIVEGRGFVEDSKVPLEMDKGIARVGQGYAFFLAGIYKIFGHSDAAVQIIQALFHALSCLILFFICLKLFKKDISEKIGLLAMGLYGFWPDLIESTAMISTEPIFLILAILSVYLAIKFFKKPSIKIVLFLSFVIGLGASIRPTIVLFILVFIILLFVKKIEKRYIYLIFFILIPAIILCVFMYRNYLQHGRFVFTTAGGYDLWVGNNLQADGEMMPSKEIRAYFEEHGFRDIDNKGISEVKKFIIEHPVQFITLQSIKKSKYFSLIRPTGWWPYLSKLGKSLTLLFSGLFGAIGFIFGISGMWLAFRKKDFFHRMLIYLTVCGPIAVIPIVVGTRYRYQIYPFLAIFAAYFLMNLFLKKQKGLYKIFLAVFIIFAFNSIYDLVINFDVFLEHLNRII